jgi:uncharacterized protein (UPF0335 family)
MSANNTFQIPTAAEVAAEVVAQLAERGMVVPGAALDIHGAAKYLGCDPKHLRKLVELRKIKARDISAGTGEKAVLRFSVVALAEYLRGE